MTPIAKLRKAVFQRATTRGVCRCECCWRTITEESGRLDHFFGRAKAEQAISNCWALCLVCDVAKTTNTPTAAYWLSRFISMARRHGYAAEMARAADRLALVQARSVLTARLGQAVA